MQTPDIHAPRAFTKEETRDHFLENVRALAHYWGTLPGKTALECCNGLAFSMLTMFDGCSSDMPAIDLAVCPHEDDKQFNIDEGSNWYESGLVFNDDVHLHEMFYGEDNS